jgi:hypothetical protein
LIPIVKLAREVIAFFRQMECSRPGKYILDAECLGVLYAFQNLRLIFDVGSRVLMVRRSKFSRALERISEMPAVSDPEIRSTGIVLFRAGRSRVS